MFRRFLGLFQKKARDREMAAEMEAHLDGLIERNVRAGLSLKEARYAALRTFGGLEQIKESAREQRSWMALERFIQDVRFGLKTLRNSPVFTLTAIITLAIGIGACTAVFSVVHISVLNPLPYAQCSQLVAVHETFLPQNPRGAVSPGAAMVFIKDTTLFTELSAFYFGPHNFIGGGGAFRSFTQHITANYFMMLGVRPLLGREFKTGENAPGAAAVVILSHRIWQAQFGGRPNVIGEVISMDDHLVTVVGVMPADFQSESTGPGTYMPFVPPEGILNAYGIRFIRMAGRLRPGITPEMAGLELDAIARRLALAHPETNKNWGAGAVSLAEETASFARPLLLTLLGAVSFLLLITCVNITNLLLAKASTQQKEIAIRMALGAGRGRIVRQMLGESFFLSGLGCVLGLLLAGGALQGMLAVSPVDLPRMADISIDRTSVLLGCGLALITGLGFGLIPALLATRVNVGGTLTQNGRGARGGARGLRLREFLVISEVALALILLVGAGLLAKSFFGMLNVDRGYDPVGLHGSSLALGSQRTATEQGVYAQQLVDKVAQVPGIVSASISTGQLTTAGSARFELARGFKDATTEPPRALYSSVTKDYFSTLEIPLREGRGFTGDDTNDSPPVVIVNEKMARSYFNDVNPIGQEVSFVANNLDKKVWRKIVGVVGDIRATNPYDPVRPQIFMPFAQQPSRWLTLGVRVTLGTTPDTRAIAAAIHAVDKDIPFTTMWAATRSADSGVPAVRRFAMVLSITLSCFALMLAAIGIYGVMAYNVTQRTGEIGIRMALGAQRGDVLRMILKDGAWLVGAGLSFGLAGSLAVVRLLDGQLYHLSPYDPHVFCGVVLVLMGVAFVACWGPARRATEVAPLTALREG